MKSKQTMSKLTILAASAFLFAAALESHAQYTPPPPPAPFPGFINEALRQKNPYMNQWDIGGALRLRFEDHEGYGIAGVGGTPTKPNNDFRSKGADVYNEYWLSRLRLHLGYTDKWWSAH